MQVNSLINSISAVFCSTVFLKTVAVSVDILIFVIFVSVIVSKDQPRFTHRGRPIIISSKFSALFCYQIRLRSVVKTRKKICFIMCRVIITCIQYQHLFSRENNNMQIKQIWRKLAGGDFDLPNYKIVRRSMATNLKKCCFSCSHYKKTNERPRHTRQHHQARNTSRENNNDAN